MTQEEVFKQLTAHAKEYGFVFPSSEIYDGLSAVYDYGQMGVELKNNIKRYWWDAMVRLNEIIVGIDSAIFMHPKIWQASGHVGAFNDPLIDNKDSKKRYRADVLIEDYIGKLEDKIAKDVEKGKKKFGEAFNEEQFLATNPNVLWSSADATIASVDENGLVTAHNRGTTTIYATVEANNTIVDSCTINVFAYMSNENACRIWAYDLTCFKLDSETSSE